jgi:hypothetical protein
MRRVSAETYVSSREAKMRNAYRLLGIAVGLNLLSTFAMSHAMASEASVRAACMNDAKKLCASAVDDANARRACMAKNKAKLSKGCKVAIRKDQMEHMPRRPR